MKKLITITTLLAAGTAFANAAEPNGIVSTETLWTMNFGSSLEGGYEIVNSSGSYALDNVWDVTGCTDESGVNISSQKRPHLVGDTGVTWGDDFKFTVTFALGDPISASNNWPVVATLTDGTNNLRFGPYTGGSNYVNLDGNSRDVFTKTLTDQVQLSSGVEYTAELYVIDNVASLYIDGVLASVGELNSATYVAGNKVNNIMIGGGNGSDYRINENVSSISMTKLSMIPEPSAFGLLAGLGALALAGTRRRRRK
ncbi:PEP-CTERM sorting domain-containing protein [Candidatus Spyradosoma sp. SGI.093]|uniref:PEP-CTERM sorting domain-containing protein n=1 Tax=Candidatus Spyradosoma sp. SGI.093 TaxID=3420583 RepID=UPI003CFFF131